MNRMILIVIFTLFASPSLAEVQMELVRNFQRPGGDYTHFNVINAQECSRKCEISGRCLAFDYHKSDSSCWLKERVYPVTEYQGVVSGIKIQKAEIKKQYPNPVKAAQAFLVQQGYNPGPVDGLMGKKTKIALQKFQSDRGLPITGFIDEVTFVALEGQQKSRSKQVTETGKKKIEPSSKPEISKFSGSGTRILNAAIFPWVLNDDANTFKGLLKEDISYRIKKSDRLRLEKSYYKIEKIPELNVSDFSALYNGNQPNISLVKQMGAERNIDLAILGTMDIHCRWSDNCQVRRMEVMLIDVVTGSIVSEKGSSWDVDARDLIESILSKAFKKLDKEMQDN